MEENKKCKICGRELPISHFSKNSRSKDGYMSMCKDCLGERQSAGRKAKRENEMKKIDDEVINARNLRLHDFTPRQLMEELKRRGYEFEATYTEVHRISSKDL